MEIHLSPAQLRSLQLAQLDILKEVDRICRENNIAYSLAGGTLLGAVRHKGYIPWDDDADIVLLRPEYDRLASVFDKMTDSKTYYFQDADNTQGYRWGFGKVRRKDTLWLREGQEHMSFGQEICIDVFPLDKVPDGKVQSKLHSLHCFLIRKILWSEVGKKTGGNRLIRGIYSILNRIPQKDVIGHYHNFANRINKGNHHLLRVLMWPTPKGFDYEGKADWYDEYLELEFEGRSFQVMQQYKEYLSLKYGNYMELPPLEQRATHGISQLKLPAAGDVHENRKEGEYMKIVVFGAGEYGRRFIESSTEGMEVVAVADNNPKLIGGGVLGHRIVNPSEIAGLDYDRVVIAIDVDAGPMWVKVYQEIYAQLIEMGVPDQSIALQSLGILPNTPRITFFRHLADLMKEHNVHGAVAECGVYRGWSAHYINHYFSERKMYLFDTFQGFDERDIEQERQPNAHKWLDQNRAYEYYQMGNREISVRRCYFRENLIVREGFVPDTFEGLEKESFAFISLDMDLYKPQYEALKFFGPRMSEGGVICLHDYYNKKLPGTKQAIDEYAKEKAFTSLPIGDGFSMALVF